MIATIPAEADVGEVAALKGTVAATATELQVSKDPAGQSGGGACQGSVATPVDQVTSSMHLFAQAVNQVQSLTPTTTFTCFVLSSSICSLQTRRNA
jgi:hypothetical protein